MGAPCILFCGDLLTSWTHHYECNSMNSSNSIKKLWKNSNVFIGACHSVHRKEGQVKWVGEVQPTQVLSGEGDRVRIVQVMYGWKERMGFVAGGGEEGGERVIPSGICVMPGRTCSFRFFFQNGKILFFYSNLNFPQFSEFFDVQPQTPCTLPNVQSFLHL